MIIIIIFSAAAGCFCWYESARHQHTQAGARQGDEHATAVRAELEFAAADQWRRPSRSPTPVNDVHSVASPSHWSEMHEMWLVVCAGRRMGERRSDGHITQMVGQEKRGGMQTTAYRQPQFAAVAYPSHQESTWVLPAEILLFGDLFAQDLSLVLCSPFHILYLLRNSNKILNKR